MSSADPLTPWARESTTSEPLARLWRSVPEPEALSEVRRQRVAVRLRGRGSRAAGRALLRLVAVGMVLGIAGAAAAHWASARWLGAELVRPAPLLPVEPARTATPKLAPQPALAASPVPTPEVEPQPSRTPVVEIKNPPPAAPAPAVSSRLALEAASLQSALVELRRGGKEQAARALAVLERHLRDFPRGTLELEAQVARVDALLLLGRRHDARRALGALPIERAGRASELRLIRAELNADDDCAAALKDFHLLVAEPLPAAWAERALFGRGACLLKAGDVAAAQRDFDRYLQQYPQGRFAAQIRAQQPGGK